MSKITTEQINNITHGISSTIETETDITISEEGLFALYDTLTRFILEKLGAEIVEPEEEFVLKNYLLMPPDFTSYGVCAYANGNPVEIHGPFETEQVALKYIFKMRQEYDDYDNFRVCKIELPSVGPFIPGKNKT